MSLITSINNFCCFPKESLFYWDLYWIYTCLRYFNQLYSKNDRSTRKNSLQYCRNIRRNAL